MLVFDCSKQGSLSFGFSCSEQFRAGEIMSDTWDMQFVHESTLPSGYQNPRCTFRIIWRWTLDLKSFAVQNFYDVNFNDRSKICFSKNCCKCSGLWVCSRKCVFLAQWDGISKNVVLVRFGLVAHTSRYPVPERCELANLCELNRLGQ